MSEALDGAKLERLYQGLLEPSCNFLPESVAGYSRLDPCPYGAPDEPPDLIHARALVEESGAGWPGRRCGRSGRGTARCGAVRHSNAPQDRPAGDARWAGAPIYLERIAPLAAHPAAFLGPFASPALLAEPEAEEVQRAWAAVDERVVEEALAAPLGTERRPAFLSDRLDAANCFSFHPVFGVDLTSLCLR